jgi:large subunit ribosomal protein L15
MNLHDVHRGIHKHKKRRRIGRGPGSGRGKTAGRGGKGQTARAGYKALPIFQGGAMPLVRRVPKRGFHNKFALDVVEVNVRDLETAFDAGAEITPDVLREKSLVKTQFDVLKILGDGEINKKLKVSAHRFSKSAKEKIEQAGGEVVVLPGRTPVEEKKKRKRKMAAGK